MGRLILPLILCILSSSTVFTFNQFRLRRSIDLAAAHSLIPDSKLPNSIQPTSYKLEIRPNYDEFNFEGVVKINLTWLEETNQITLHIHQELYVEPTDIRVTQTELDDTVRSTTPTPLTELKIKRNDRHPKKPIYTIHLEKALKRGSQCELHIKFSGTLWENTEGLFRGSYPIEDNEKRNYIATYFQPNNARRVFPCFDEPSYKVPFTVSIGRPKEYITLFNTAVESTTEINKEYIIDHFETTPPMSTYTLGFVTSKLEELDIGNSTVSLMPTIKIWSRPNLHGNLIGLYDKVNTILKSIENYFGIPYPLNKLDIVALPGFASIKPADNWGLVVLKESEIMSKGNYILAQEIAYQWLGAWATPYWWSDAHVTKAVGSFLAYSTSFEIDNGFEFNGKWPMMTLYSTYYEYSKRYPHSRITGMKQEVRCSKTELMLRMLNYTLGGDTLRKGLQTFIADREYKSFFADDIWNALSNEAHKRKVLDDNMSINEIAASWITIDRLPVVTITRNYEQKSACVSQKVYLRERPHDVPEQDKLLWYIPLVIVSQNQMDFTNTKPTTWMRKVREIKIADFPDASKFVIVNPEEIGPFPVNYDKKNWDLIAEYLKTESGRSSVPAYTKAKLIHDSWNLAFAGELDFATAFNMISFIKYERDHIVWEPIFTFIDHVGRHIDVSKVHKKFMEYVLTLLTPLYEYLGPVEQDNEESWKDNQRRYAKSFLCNAGYEPCIREAQTAYKKWMDQENPDEGNPVPVRHLCPVFAWGTQEEWDFALQRVINFPASRKQSERTYLLKSLAGCPTQKVKMEKLLNITILEENGNFTENDLFLIFNMLTGGSTGYTTLFEFLSNNWDFLKVRFDKKTNLWDNLIGSATSSFTTQEGYDKVSALYVQRQGEFSSAEHIIEKSLKNIKEETKWSNENLPIIEKWLDTYLKTVDKQEKPKDRSSFTMI